MARIKIDFQKYHTAVLAVKDAAASSKPIKRTEFISKNELTPTFFRVMEDLKIIKELSTNNVTGSVFQWIYNQASNEENSKVTMRITEKIQDLNRETYIKYSSPEAKERARIRKIRKDLEKQKSRTYNGPSVIIREAAPITYEVPQENNQEFKKFLGVEESPVEVLENQAVNQSELTGATNIKFELSGLYSKSDIIKAIENLVEEKQISSFSLNVNYGD